MQLFIANLVILALSYLAYHLFLKPYWYWKRRNVPHVKPSPVVGNLGSLVFQTCPFAQRIQDIYAAHPDARYVGFHKFLQPALLIRDPELIKSVTVQNWNVFPHHSLVVSEDVDPLWGNSIVAMNGGERWRQMRSLLGFTFTSSKLKNMFCLIKNCARHAIEHIDKTNGGTITIDARETFSKYTNDVIATTAFGINCNSFEHPNNNFYAMGKEATNFEGLCALKFFLNGLNPYLMRILHVRIYSRHVRNFFYGVIKKTVKKRRECNIVRPDMIHLMMNAKKNGSAVNREATSQEGNGIINNNKLIVNYNLITAQALIFFIGGFDSTATVTSFAAYELACNLDVQKTLRKEIDLVYKACEGDITYDALTSLKYLEMVVLETLRKWPTIFVTDRALVNPYTIESRGKGSPEITIGTDVCCAIPIFSIHRDSKYFPNPDKFDPERFSEKNKANIKPYTYMPFGSGPRGCIGSRFALLEMKLVLAEIIHKFEIVPVSETEIPIRLCPRGFLLRPDKNITLGLKRRNDLINI